jgi:hypothetical protein
LGENAMGERKTKGQNKQKARSPIPLNDFLDYR